MFKTIKKITSCFLALCMLLTIAPMGVFATETEPFNYVSIGDSMTNGYCFDGYNQGDGLPDFIDDNGNGVYGDAAYPELIADWLEGSYTTVNHTRLAPSAMRAEDLLYLLGGRETPADDWYGQVENYTNCDDDAVLSQFFTDSVTNANLITMGIGNASFGAFLLQHVTDAIGVMGNSPIDPDITLANALALLDAEQQDVVMQVYNYMEKELDKYIPADMQTRFNIPAVLDITAYTAAGFILNYKNVIERIVELNSDVEIILVGLMNTTYGMNITADDMPSIPVGDIMDNVFGALNAYIAGLPAVMQRAGNYSDAKFYYSEIDDIEFIVQKFDDLKAANWASIDGLSGQTVRERTIRSYNNSLRELINPANPTITLANVQTFEGLGIRGPSDWPTAIAAGLSPELATSVAIYLAIEDALAASVETMDIPLNDLMSVAGDISGIFSGLTPDSTSPVTLRTSLADALSADELKPLCKIYSLFKIGDGMSVHPTPAAHAALAEKIISAYENEYTAEDKIIDSAIALVELIAKYGEDAVKEVYAYLENEGYIAELETAIYELLAELENPDSDLSQKLVAETDKLLAILEAETGEELPSGEEVITAIRNYEETLADIEEYIANNEEIQEDIAKIENIIARINDIIANPEAYIQNVIADVVAKFEENLDAATSADYAICGDNHYVAFAGTNTSGVEDYEYSYNFGDYIDVTDASTHYFTDGTAIADAVDYIETTVDKADLKDATIVTYQTDAKNIVLHVFDLSPVTIDDWATLLNVDSSRVEEIKATIIAALKGEYAGYATDVSNVATKAGEIKNSILEKLPVDWADALTAEVQNAEIDVVVESILNTVIAGLSGSIDATLVDAIDSYAEELVFNTVAYLINNIKAVETIKAINPDALIAVVGLHNPVKGLKFNIDGQIIDLGEYVDYFIEATNAYNAVYAMSAENVIFVEADETEIAGYSDIIAINTTDLGTLGLVVANIKGILETGTVVTESGHNYIVNQLKTAITKVNHIDADDNDVCDKCGANLAPVTPTPNPGPGGGGGIVSRITITFETNGGSKLDSVKVAEGKTLVAPKTPVKEGYIFDGWYTDKELTQKYDFSTPVTKAFTLYAKWIESENIGLKFTDIKSDAWYYDVVKTIVEKGLMNGISETEFAPEMEVTRGMFVTILYRAAGEPQVAKTTSFADVAADTYYAKAVAWASANGIVNGITETEFAPDNNITREQMAAILYRYTKNETVEGEITYTDKDAISDYALDAINWAYAAGIMTGNEDGTFAPLRNSSRAEAAAVFVRLLD